MPARAQVVQKLVFAEEEALVPAFEQPLALPLGQQAFVDEEDSDLGGVGRRHAAGLCLQLRHRQVKLILIDQSTGANQTEKAVDSLFHDAHAA